MDWSINQSNPVLLKERVRIPRTRRAGGAAMLWGRLPLDGVGSCRLFFTDDLHDNLSWVPASDKPHTFKSCFTHSSQVFFGRPGPFRTSQSHVANVKASSLWKLACFLVKWRWLWWLSVVYIILTLAFSVISQHWNDGARWNPSSRKTRANSSYTVNMIVADDLATEARASATDDDLVTSRRNQGIISHGINSLAPENFEWNFKYSNLQIPGNFNDWWLRYFLWTCP